MGLEAGWLGPIPGLGQGTARTGSRTKESVTKAGAREDAVARAVLLLHRQRLWVSTPAARPLNDGVEGAIAGRSFDFLIQADRIPAGINRITTTPGELWPRSSLKSPKRSPFCQIM
jgi:hypothetical protein